MILPITLPPITSDPQYTDLLTTILPYKGGHEWYISNFIQIYTDFIYYDTYGKGELRFREQKFIINKAPYASFWYDGIPFLKSFNTIDDISLLIDKKLIVDYFKTIISSGHYIITCMDRHYVDKRYALGTIHGMLIYGYDESSFKIAYFVSDSGKYTFSEITFDSAFKSINHTTDYDPLSPSGTDERVVFFKMGDSDYKMDTQLVRRLLEDYYLERNTTESYECLAEINRYGHDVKWGMGCYKYLIDYINSLEAERLDVKSLYLLSDHKKAMVERVEYFLSADLLTDSSLLNEFAEIRDNATSCVALGLKYTITGRKKILSDIISQLQIIYDLEKKALRRMLDNFNG